MTHRYMCDCGNEFDGLGHRCRLHTELSKRGLSDSELINHIQFALNTEENGLVFVEVARNAHKAEQREAERIMKKMSMNSAYGNML